MSYQDSLHSVNELTAAKGTNWNGIFSEAVAQMKSRSRFPTELDVARYTATFPRGDMAKYNANPRTALSRLMLARLHCPTTNNLH